MLSASAIQRTDPNSTFALPFSPGHILGTDDLGRDHLSRLLFAAQVSLSVGFIAAILSLSIGVSLGIITGYYGGVTDDIVTWVISTLNSIPSLFLLLIVAAVLQPSPIDLDHRSRFSRLDDDHTTCARRNSLDPRARIYPQRAIGGRFTCAHHVRRISCPTCFRLSSSRWRLTSAT